MAMQDSQAALAWLERLVSLVSLANQVQLASQALLVDPAKAVDLAHKDSKAPLDLEERKVLLAAQDAASRLKSTTAHMCESWKKL
jgi:hypothetical protein